MLKAAGIGVAMGNASETVKASADFVTDTVENDGLCKALKHFGIKMCIRDRSYSKRYQICSLSVISRFCSIAVVLM